MPVLNSRSGRQRYARNKRTSAERLRLKRVLVDLLGGKCIDCGYSTHLAALDFDHIDPFTKSFALSFGLNAHSKELCEIEAKKCELRCANCHRVKTHPNAHCESF